MARTAAGDDADLAGLGRVPMLDDAWVVGGAGKLGMGAQQPLEHVFNHQIGIIDYTVHVIFLRRVWDEAKAG